MTKKQEKELENKIKIIIDEQRVQGIKAGAKGILGAVLKMCNENKTIADIKEFCEKNLVVTK